MSLEVAYRPCALAKCGSTAAWNNQGAPTIRLNLPKALTTGPCLVPISTLEINVPLTQDQPEEDIGFGLVY